jgi:uncharacterized protein
MRNGCRVAAIIPALNEELSIGKVISEIPSWVDDVVVVDNGSSDRTAEQASKYGARVLREDRRGYGSACLTGIRHLHDPDIVLFLDGDFSDYPGESATLVDPVTAGDADLVIGSRVLGRPEPGALTPQARFGNWLACLLIHAFWTVRFTDLGPFRAISFPALTGLCLRDPDYGWTVEMQVKAVMAGLKVKEVPVSYRKRIGTSKVSGTVRGVVGAGVKILGTIFLCRAGLWPSGVPSAAPDADAVGPGRSNARGSRWEQLPDRVVVFTRYPEPGKTKTRLIPVLGAEGAAAFQRTMAERVLMRLRELEHGARVDTEIRYEGGSQRLMRRWLGTGIRCREQHPGDIGHRMFMAFSDAFREGAERVVLVGTDVPGLSAQLVERAFRKLKSCDVVLGPANDGGYYLIGLKRPHKGLFVGVPWSTSGVLQRTLEIARELGLSTVLLDWLNDVDRPEDLAMGERENPAELSSHKSDKEPHSASAIVCRAAESLCDSGGRGESTCRCVAGSAARLEPSANGHPVSQSGSHPRISVIIPTLNEASSLPETLADLEACRGIEIIVVDGGSDDGTFEHAQGRGVRVLRGPARRAGQMNLAAYAATGDILLFLHADTRLPQGWMDQVERVAADPQTAGGAFHLAISGGLRGMKFIEKLANFRAKRLKMPYGDQAIFVRTEVFRRLGGFPDIPIMEDFELVRRLRRWGEITIAPGIAVTSGRRWVDRGVFLTTVINQVIIAGYLLGLSPALLAKLRTTGRNRDGRARLKMNG